DAEFMNFFLPRRQPRKIAGNGIPKRLPRIGRVQRTGANYICSAEMRDEIERSGCKGKRRAGAACGIVRSVCAMASNWKHIIVFEKIACPIERAKGHIGKAFSDTARAPIMHLEILSQRAVEPPLVIVFGAHSKPELIDDITSVAVG